MKHLCTIRFRQRVRKGLVLKCLNICVMLSFYEILRICAESNGQGKRALGKRVLDKNGSASEGSIRGSYPRRSWAKGGGGSGGRRIEGGGGIGKPFATFSKTFPFKEVSLLIYFFFFSDAQRGRAMPHVRGTAKNQVRSLSRINKMHMMNHDLFLQM